MPTMARQSPVTCALCVLCQAALGTTVGLACGASAVSYTADLVDHPMLIQESEKTPHTGNPATAK